MKKISKQLIEILRFIFFIPAGFLAGTIVLFPVSLILKFYYMVIGFVGFVAPSWIPHLAETIIYYYAGFITSIYIKPKFLKSKYFILAWSVLLGFNACIFMMSFPNPEYLRKIDIVIDAFAPIGVLIFLIKEKHDFLKLRKRNKLSNIEK